MRRGARRVVDFCIDGKSLSNCDNIASCQSSNFFLPHHRSQPPCHFLCALLAVLPLTFVAATSPSPSWPESFRPQEKTSPPSARQGSCGRGRPVRTRVWLRPHATPIILFEIELRASNSTAERSPQQSGTLRWCTCPIPHHGTCGRRRQRGRPCE